MFVGFDQEEKHLILNQNLECHMNAVWSILRHKPIIIITLLSLFFLSITFFWLLTTHLYSHTHKFSTLVPVSNLHALSIIISGGLFLPLSFNENYCLRWRHHHHLWNARMYHDYSVESIKAWEYLTRQSPFKCT